MTRVLHAVVAGAIGGAERMLVDLASGRAGHAIALLTPNPSLSRMLRDAGLRVHERGPVREGPLPYLWRTLGPVDVAWIARVVREEGAAVIHLHTFGSQVVGTRAALRAGAKTVRTEHSTRAFEDPSCWPFARWSLLRADRSVAVSEHVRAGAAARAPWASHKMSVIYNGVDATRFAPVEPPREAFRFAVVGRLEPRKGVDQAIDALSLVPGAHLDIVGDGPSRRDLHARARARRLDDRVVFHGYVDDTRPLVARASAVLSSSRSEGLGLSLLEAMAMERPIVGFAVGGVPEVVVHGATGLLAPAGDVAALGARMREAVEAGARLTEWGRAARARVLARFSLAGMRDQYDRVYEDALSTHPPLSEPRDRPVRRVPAPRRMA